MYIYIYGFEHMSKYKTDARFECVSHHHSLIHMKFEFCAHKLNGVEK